MIYTLDWSLPQMLLCCKLSEFAWSVYDGKKAKKDSSSPTSEVDRERSKKAITEFPSLLEYYSFCFNFVGFLTGPFLEFEEYRDFVRQSVAQKIPLDWVVVGSKFVFAVFNILMMRFGDMFSDSFALKPEFTATYSFPARLVYLWIALELSYCKYYFAWSMGEGACAAIGMSFNGYDEKTKKAKWDRTRMMDLITFKLADNWKDMIDNWNIPCQVWLKHCKF